MGSLGNPGPCLEQFAAEVHCAITARHWLDAPVYLGCLKWDAAMIKQLQGSLINAAARGCTDGWHALFGGSSLNVHADLAQQEHNYQSGLLHVCSS